MAAAGFADTLDRELEGEEPAGQRLLACGVGNAVGVGLGSLLCERMSGHRIELGLVPFGSIGLSLFAIDLYFAQPVAAVTSVTSIGEFIGRPGTLRMLADVVLHPSFSQQEIDRQRQQALSSLRVNYADAGYLGTNLTIGLSKRFNSRFRLIAGTRLGIYNGATNDSSPLFRDKLNVGVFTAFAWTFAQSTEPAR